MGQVQEQVMVLFINFQASFLHIKIVASLALKNPTAKANKTTYIAPTANGPTTEIIRQMLQSYLYSWMAADKIFWKFKLH